MPTKPTSILTVIGVKEPVVVDKQKEAAARAVAEEKRRETQAKLAAKKAKEARIGKVCKQIAADLAPAFAGVKLGVKALTNYGATGFQKHEKGYGYFQISDLLFSLSKPRDGKRSTQYSLCGYAPTKSTDWDTRQIQWRMEQYKLGPKSKVSPAAIKRIIAAAPQGTIFDCQQAIEQNKRDANASAIREIARGQAHQ